MKYILALDEGTTSARAAVIDVGGKCVGMAQNEFRQYFPAEGYVEHNPEEILSAQLSAARSALRDAGISAADVESIGITNQRETVLIWDKTTGKPLYNAIVWQCRRTADMVNQIRSDGLSTLIHDKTGLIIDPYFTATKLSWLLDNVPGARAAAEAGTLLSGTVDSWLIWNLTGRHVTDVTNASRTMLYNIHQRQWDNELLKLFNIPDGILPEVLPSCGFFGETKESFFGKAIPIYGVAGDQQAALFGQRCFLPGQLKNTYGTGGFLLMNTGKTAVNSAHGLLTTLAIDDKCDNCYALEGSVFVAGAAVQWLRDELGIISGAEETEALAKSVPTSGGVYFVPAFSGLGAPYWNYYVRGSITGLTRGVGKAHIARAALEAIAYQTADVVASMEKDTGGIASVRADGGASENSFLMQFQADILGMTIVRPAFAESTVLGAAYLAGIGVGLWPDTASLPPEVGGVREFSPSMSATDRRLALGGWRKAVEALIHS